MLTGKKPTAADLKKELEASAEFVRQRAVKEQQRLVKTAELARAEAPLVAALRAGGIQLSSVWDLVNRKNDYPEAVPILRDHLRAEYPEEVLEGIARALAIPAAIDVRSDLVEMLRERLGLYPNVRYAMCLAIAATTSTANLNETVELARDKGLGSCRAGLLSALKKHRKRQDVQEHLPELSADPVLAVEIASWRR